MEDNITQKNKLKRAAEVADALVNHAKLQSEQLLLEANRQASLIVKEAEQVGLHQGQKKAFSNLISGENLLRETIEQAKYIILDISVEIAKDIIINEITINPNKLKPKIDSLLTKVMNARNIKIYVHPNIKDELIELVKSNIEEHIHIQVCSDPELKISDIKIVTELGEIKAILEHELNEISLKLRANSNNILK